MYSFPTPFPEIRKTIETVLPMLAGKNGDRNQFQRTYKTFFLHSWVNFHCTVYTVLYSVQCFRPFPVIVPLAPLVVNFCTTYQLSGINYLLLFPKAVSLPLFSFNLCNFPCTLKEQSQRIDTEIREFL